MKVILGTNKEVTLAPWKAKTKKEFIKLVQRKGDEISGNELADVLIRQNIDKPDIFLNPDEAQYILIKLKEISIGDEVKFDMDCDNEKCKKTFAVQLSLNDICKYTPSKYPSKTENFSWREIPNQKVFDDISDNTEETYVNIEMMLHLDAINGEESVSFLDTLDKVDNLSLKDTDELEAQYFSVMAYLEMGSEIECPHCKHKEDYQFDIIPHFFEELLPN